MLLQLDLCGESLTLLALERSYFWYSTIPFKLTICCVGNAFSVTNARAIDSITFERTISQLHLVYHLFRNDVAQELFLVVLYGELEHLVLRNGMLSCQLLYRLFSLETLLLGSRYAFDSFCFVVPVGFCISVAEVVVVFAEKHGRILEDQSEVLRLFLLI